MCLCECVSCGRSCLRREKPWISGQGRYWYSGVVWCRYRLVECSVGVSLGVDYLKCVSPRSLYVLIPGGRSGALSGLVLPEIVLVGLGVRQTHVEWLDDLPKKDEMRNEGS